MRTASWIAPSGTHALSTIRPPRVVTLAISAAAAAGSGAKITPNTDSTTSAARSSTGSDSASPSANVTLSPRAAASSRATSSSRVAGSTPIARAPRAAASSAAFPVPHPTSTTLSPGVGAARSTTTRAAGKLRRGLLVVPETPIQRAGRLWGRSVTR
jgi:hypothetical protein